MTYFQKVAENQTSNSSDAHLRFTLKFWILSIVFLLLSATSVSAFTFYVGTNGNDKFSGKLAHPNAQNTDGPFATLTAARNAIRKMRQSKPTEAFIVEIAAGTYYLNEPFVLLPEDSGTAAAPVNYRSTGGAVFVGGMPVNNFQVKNGLWVARLPALLAKHGFEQLYVDGERAVRAKSPNNGFFAPKKVVETVIEKGSDRVAAKATQKVYVKGNDAGWLKFIKKEEINKVVLTFYHKWDNTRKYIDSLNLTDSSITVRGQGMKSWNPLNDKTQYIAENFKAALDTAGEWLLEQSGTLYYKPLPGQTIQNTTVLAPLTQQLLVIKGASATQSVSFINFENIAFKVSGYQLPASGQEPVQAAAPVEAAVMIDYANNVNFKNCEIANTGANGIWYREGCNNSTVSECYLHDLGAGGIKLGALKLSADTAEITNHITIDNNIINSGGYTFPCAAGIAVFHAFKNKITHNNISDFRYSGISVGWVWGYKPSVTHHNTISYNHIHHLGWGELSDMGGIYTLGPSPGTQITNNVIHHIYSRTYGGWGLYTDEGSSDILLENNLVYDTKSAGFHQHYGKNNIIQNNIFAMGIESQLQMSRAETHQSFTLKRNIIYYKQGELFKTNSKKYWENAVTAVDSNIYWNASARQPNFPFGGLEGWRKSGHDQHSSIADPGFVDAEHFNFSIRNTEVIKQIGFKPFDYNNSGVYGNKAWLDKAMLPKAKLASFDELMQSTNKVFSEH
ncbi:right-handed parallel beta-helix repeat-containing protein [uncultured Mucilaginibacter sp.]|uniref:right-handed parallel beta-helix repeat-containing protein n=1 Tax=uncultured Mucilaginibacter sp. TaxID=797541 RepID=UPI0025E28783|nr:right-handed parallel beta-helix repeat-containing protein [uncultured Mucilaginibacter sp.]